MDVRRFRMRRKRLTEIPGALADPVALCRARRRAAFFWLLFFAVQRKVTRAKRETLLLRFKQQRVQALEKEKARSKWMTSHSAVVEHFQRSLG